LTPSSYSTDSDALVEFDVAARAVLRGASVSQVVSAPLERQISGQIAVAAVYANQASILLAEEVHPLGPIFPRGVDMDLTDSVEEETAGGGDETGETETETAEGSFLPSV